MFVGRKEEIRSLENFYSSDRFEMLVLYGRRRVGKTRLLTEFIKDKNAIFFVAEENNDQRNIEQFSQVVFSHFGREAKAVFEHWDAAFRYIVEESEDKRTVVVLDEMPYLAEANASFMSILQNVIDHHMINSKVMLVLCGSPISFMENELVAYKSPLYGRKTGQIKLKPLDFFEMSQMFPDYSIEDRLRIYAICGGIPQYLIALNRGRSVDENIVDVFMNSNTFIYDEPMNLLRQAFRKPAVYNAIIEAIANGCSRINEISQRVGETSSKTTNYISSLMELELVEKKTPIGEKSSRKSIYRLSDNLFVFMYNYVYKNRSLIERGMGAAIYEKKLKKAFNSRLGFVFEEICNQYLWKRNQTMNLPFWVEDIGTWWGNNPAKKCEEEIDLVGLSKDEGLYCECKYSNEKVSEHIYETLIERSYLIPRKQKYYMLFSKGGFGDGLVKRASSDPQLELVNLDDINEWMEQNNE